MVAVKLMVKVVVPVVLVVMVMVGFVPSWEYLATFLVKLGRKATMVVGRKFV